MHTAGLLPFIRLLAVPDQGWLNHLMEALMLLETARSHILLGIFIGASAERADAEICGFRIRTTRNCYSLILYREAGLPVCEATKSLRRALSKTLFYPRLRFPRPNFGFEVVLQMTAGKIERLILPLQTTHH